MCASVAFITRDQDDAREVVADLFGNLWERRASWTISSSIEAYLFVAARHRALSLQRNVKRRDNLVRTELVVNQVVGIPAMSTDASASTSLTQQRLELKLTLERVISQLPERYQSALYLRWERDLSYEEIARILESTPAAVKKLVNRATIILRDRIRDDPRF